MKTFTRTTAQKIISLMFLSFATAPLTLAKEVILNSGNLAEYTVQAAEDGINIKYTATLLLKSGRSLTTYEKKDYAADSPENSDDLKTLRTQLSRVKSGRLGFRETKRGVICYKTIGIFNDGALDFDTELHACP